MKGNFLKNSSETCNFSVSGEFLRSRTMNRPPQDSSSRSPDDLELTQDQELWDILDDNPPPKASALFSRNVIREIRRQEGASTGRRLFGLPSFSPRVLAPLAIAGLAVAAVVFWNPSSSSPAGFAKTSDSDPLPLEVASSLESSLESELLLAAADAPDLFSDEEVIAMLF